MENKDAKGNLDLRSLMTGTIQKLLGNALDYCRMSGMTDRNLKQIQRSLKDDYYKMLDFIIAELEAAEYIEKSSESVSDHGFRDENQQSY